MQANVTEKASNAFGYKKTTTIQGEKV